MSDATVIFRCAECESTSLITNPDGTLTCVRCGADYEIVGRHCSACGTTNPPEAEYCEHCGRLLDLVGFILQRCWPVATQERLERFRTEVARLKEETEAASQERLRRWWAEEEERRRALAAAQAERDRQERRLLLGALVFGAVVLLGILLYVILRGL